MANKDTRRVNFNKSLQMHLACATDDLRVVMEHIYFQDGFAYASDAHVLVKNDLSVCSSISREQIEILNGKLLHKDAYKEILKYDVIDISEEGIQCKKGNNTAFFYFNTDSSLKYPEAKELVEKKSALSTVPIPQISINTKLIEIMNKALYHQRELKFTFKGVNESIICEDNDIDSTNCVGLIMPCMTL